MLLVGFGTEIAVGIVTVGKTEKVCVKALGFSEWIFGIFSVYPQNTSLFD